MTVVAKYGVGQLPTAQEMTNLYLYGQKEKPADLLDPSSWDLAGNYLPTTAVQFGV